jgi:hypothetical protein
LTEDVLDPEVARMTTKITTKTITDLNREYRKWIWSLNMLVGAPSFAVAVSCIGNTRPDVTGLVSLVFMIVVGLPCRRKFPKTLLLLRKMRLSEVDKLTLLGIEKKYLSLGAAVTQAPVFVLCWAFLGAVIIWGGWHHVTFP